MLNLTLYAARSSLLMSDYTETLTLEPSDDNQRLANLCGQLDENLRLVERRLHVDLRHRGHTFKIHGHKDNVQRAINVLQELYQRTQHNHVTELHDVHLALRHAKQQDDDPTPEQTPGNHNSDKNEVVLNTKIGTIKGRTPNQKTYLHNIINHDVIFGIGPAGTGKTFLAVACTIQALERQSIDRIILVRPVVEAGESLGFLPGDLQEKVNPYLRPIYDALYSMLGFEQVERLLEKNIIEIAPLAYMRGRTLDNAFIILDEGQNTTIAQMKMFLTRLGFGSKAVVTGDITQVDLLNNQTSGLRHVMEILSDIDAISFNFFSSEDVVRHPIVQKILQAYERHETP